MGQKVGGNALFSSVPWEISRDDDKQKDEGAKEDYDDIIFNLPVKNSVGSKKKEKTNLGEKRTCSICLCEEEEGEEVMDLVCKHSFHKDCLVGWTEDQSKGGDRFVTNHASFIQIKTKGYDALNARLGQIKGNWVLMCQLLLSNDNLKKKEKKQLKDLKKVQEKNTWKNGEGEALVKLKEMEEKCKFIEDYLFFLCYNCGELYFGGMKDCGMEEDDKKNNKEDRLCAKCCQMGDNPKECGKHGATFIAYKCRYCCNVANWFCFGTTHFCESCHSKYPDCKVINCPGSPKCQVKHKNGKEQCLGCVLCCAANK